MKPVRPVSASELVLPALFAALTAALSQLSIPLPSGVPLTLQTFAVALCGFCLGVRQGAFSVLSYLLLGAVGLPVFAGFRAGAGILFGVTGGFLWGFPPLAALSGTKRPLFAALGLLLCHGLGVLQFSVVSQTPLFRSFVLVSLPYLVKDGLSVLGAFFAARPALRALKAVQR